MVWYQPISYSFGGAYLDNAAPHLVNGVSGRRFQSPFAKPPGQGLSSSTVNVLWGFLNRAIAYLRICRVGAFRFLNTARVLTLGAGMVLLSLMHARGFGRFHGGNLK